MRLPSLRRSTLTAAACAAALLATACAAQAAHNLTTVWIGADPQLEAPPADAGPAEFERAIERAIERAGEFQVATSGGLSKDGCHGQKGRPGAHCHGVTVERVNRKYSKSGANRYRVVLKNGRTLTTWKAIAAPVPKAKPRCVDERGRLTTEIGQFYSTRWKQAATDLLTCLSR